MSKLPQGVAGYECKHAFYSAASDYAGKAAGDDVVLVKRNVHHTDGTVTPEVTFIENYERDFYVVNEAHRTYDEKKAWEDEYKCKRFKCRQTKLTDTVIRALGRTPSGWIQKSVLFRNQFVYGADITTTAIIKKAYMDKFPDFNVESTMGVMDIETDVVTGDGTEIISASFTFKNEIYLAYTEKFMAGITDISRKLQEKFEYYIGGLADDLADDIAAREKLVVAHPEALCIAEKVVRTAFLDFAEVDEKDEELVKVRDKVLSDAQRVVVELNNALSKNVKRIPVLTRAQATLRERSKLTINTKLVSTPAQVTQYVFEAAHKTKPDFISFWNINFDLPKMIASLEKAGVDPKHVFCDPAVPEKYKRFNYRPGQAIKQKAGGKSSSKHFTELWHVVDAPASFYLIDAMCVFKQVRVTEGMRNSYSLDNILKDELDLGKLKFTESEGMMGLELHIYMQTNHKLEYLIYNIFDCMSIEILDDKTKDMALTVPTLCQHSDYARFPSTPRRLCDDMHFYLKSQKKVISTTSDDMAEKQDSHVIGSDNWIVTLPSHLVADNGLQLLKEAPHVRSMLRAHVADLDVEGSYPNTGSFMNISMETTAREVVQVGEINEYDKRMAGLNLTAAPTNAVECSTTFFNFPTLDTLLTEYKRQEKEKAA